LNSTIFHHSFFSFKILLYDKGLYDILEALEKYAPSFHPSVEMLISSDDVRSCSVLSINGTKGVIQSHSSAGQSSDYVFGWDSMLGCHIPPSLNRWTSPDLQLLPECSVLCWWDRETIERKTDEQTEHEHAVSDETSNPELDI